MTRDDVLPHDDHYPRHHVLDAQIDKLLWLQYEGHALRVSDLTGMVCAAMGLRGAKQLLAARRGALLHDIGKLYVPERILLKPDKLNEREWAIMHQHPEWGAEMIKACDALNGDWVIAMHHHERWDGKGYPAGLAGEQIPLEARAFAPIDVLDALMSKRSYRGALSEKEAWRIVHEGSGTLFDPRAVVALNVAWNMMLARVPMEAGDPVHTTQESAVHLLLDDNLKERL